MNERMRKRVTSRPRWVCELQPRIKSRPNLFLTQKHKPGNTKLVNALSLLALVSHAPVDLVLESAPRVLLLSEMVVGLAATAVALEAMTAGVDLAAETRSSLKETREEAPKETAKSS